MQHTHIKGLGAKLDRFTGILDDIKARPYDLLDFSVTQFDRDFLEFNVHINELELALKAGPENWCPKPRAHDSGIDVQGCAKLNGTRNP